MSGKWPRQNKLKVTGRHAEGPEGRSVEEIASRLKWEACVVTIDGRQYYEFHATYWLPPSAKIFDDGERYNLLLSVPDPGGIVNFPTIMGAEDGTTWRPGPRAGDAPGPDGVICGWGCDPWTISMECDLHRG